MKNIEVPCSQNLVVLNRYDISKLRQLCVPSRIAALEVIHRSGSITFPDLATELGIKNHALDVTVGVLKGLDLVEVNYVANPGHGVIRIIKSLITGEAGPLNISIMIQLDDVLSV